VVARIPPTHPCVPTARSFWLQGKEITWRNAAALDGYVRRLNEVADRLAEKNRTLRKWHSVLSEKVVTLAGTDLVRHKDKWAAGVKEMREVFGRLEAEGYSRESQQVGWDHVCACACGVRCVSCDRWVVAWM
jgi:hypothetical protein